MTPPTAFVYVDLRGIACRVGRPWTVGARGREAASFEYDAAWLRHLWRRIVFNVLASNLDDHLRNHRFLYTGSEGWRLSPAYDLNPVPADVKPRFLTTSISTDEDASASLELALAVARDFGLREKQARTIVRDVAGAVRQWRDVASRIGLTPRACDRMASAFEHEDAEAACRCGGA